MGHSGTRAALIYLDFTDERQREIADALGELEAGELKQSPAGHAEPTPEADRARNGHGGKAPREDHQESMRNGF
jgi:hypothetical protein